MEEEVKRLEELMANIGKAVEMSNEKANEIRSKSEEAKIILETRKEVENLKAQKKEFDEMTLGAFIRASRKMDEIKQAYQKEISSIVERKAQLTDKVNRMYDKMNERDQEQSAEKIESVKAAANVAMTNLEEKERKAKEDLIGLDAKFNGYLDQIIEHREEMTKTNNELGIVTEMPTLEDEQEGVEAETAKTEGETELKEKTSEEIEQPEEKETEGESDKQPESENAGDTQKKSQPESKGTWKPINLGSEPKHNFTFAGIKINEAGINEDKGTIQLMHKTEDGEIETEDIEAKAKESMEILKDENIRKCIKEVIDSRGIKGRIAKWRQTIALRRSLNPLVLNGILNSKEISSDNKYEVVKKYMESICTREAMPFTIEHNRTDTNFTGRIDRVLNRAAKAIKNIEGCNVIGEKYSIWDKIKARLGVKSFPVTSVDEKEEPVAESSENEAVTARDSHKAFVDANRTETAEEQPSHESESDKSSEISRDAFKSIMGQWQEPKDIASDVKAEGDTEERDDSKTEEDLEH